MTHKEFKDIKSNIKGNILKDVTFNFTDLNGKEAIHSGAIQGVQGDCLILLDDHINCNVIVHYTSVYLA